MQCRDKFLLYDKVVFPPLPPGRQEFFFSLSESRFVRQKCKSTSDFFERAAHLKHALFKLLQIPLVLKLLPKEAAEISTGSIATFQIQVTFFAKKYFSIEHLVALSTLKLFETQEKMPLFQHLAHLQGIFFILLDTTRHPKIKVSLTKEVY